MTSYTSRLRGALYGALIGDALGVPYEFNSASGIPAARDIEFNPPPTFERSHHKVPVGTWSDDGALTLALLRSLLEHPKLSLDDFATRMLAWHEHGEYTPDGVVFDVGVQTATALNLIAKGAAPELAAPPYEEYNGNGSLMRTLPVAFFATSDLAAIALARRQSLPTHSHTWSQLCCALYVLIARRLLAGESIQDAVYEATHVLPALLANSDEVAFARMLMTNRTAGQGKGFVVDCLWSALDCLEQSSCFEQAVKSAVALGNDTDTTACVVGGLAGAFYGVDEIPVRWMQELRGKALVESLITRYLGSRVFGNREGVE